MFGIKSMCSARDRKLTFSLRSLAFVILALPVGFGFVLAIEQLAWLVAFDYFDYPRSWGLYRALRDMALSYTARAHLIVFDGAVPYLLVLGMAGFTVGLVRSRAAHIIFWSIPVSICLLPLGGEVSYFAAINIWRNVAACGAVFVALCWGTGYLVRGGKCAAPPNPLPLRLNQAVCALVVGAGLLLSAYGWQLFHDPEQIPSRLLLNCATGLFLVVLPCAPLVVLARDWITFVRRGSAEEGDRLD